jgi:hypothetical protein
MSLLRNLPVLLLSATLLTAPVFAKKHDHENHDKGRGPSKHEEPVVVFRDQDRFAIQEYYRRGKIPPGLAKHGGLPPGLEKQLRRNGTLPPGIAKKMTPLPVALERQLPPPPTECRRGIIDGQVVLYNAQTQFVLDVFAPF